MCTTSLSTRFLGSAHGTRETQTMQTSSILVDKAQQLAAAGRHTEVIACLGARDASDLDGSPDLALLYGTAQARLGRHAEGLRWLDAALEQARKGGERGVESRALNARGAMSLVSGRPHAPGAGGDPRVPRRAAAGAARVGPGSGPPRRRARFCR